MTALILKHQPPRMIAKGGGAIVNASPLFGVMAAYRASKWGVIGSANSAALEVARKNIRLNAIAPGSVMTALLTGMFGSEQSAKDNGPADDPYGPVSATRPRSRNSCCSCPRTPLRSSRDKQS